MVVHFDVGHAVLPQLAGSFAVAKSGNGGNAGGNGAGNHGGVGNSRGGGDEGSAGRDTNPGVGDISPKRTGSAHRRLATPAVGLHDPAPGQRPTTSAKARDMRVRPQQAKHTLVASGLTDADLAKLIARGFHVLSQTRGSLSPRTIQLQPPHSLSLEQARRAVRSINPNAVVDFDSYYYTDGETTNGFSKESPDQSIHEP